MADVCVVGVLVRPLWLILPVPTTDDDPASEAEMIEKGREWEVEEWEAEYIENGKLPDKVCEDAECDEDAECETLPPPPPTVLAVFVTTCVVVECGCVDVVNLWVVVAPPPPPPPVAGCRVVLVE